MNRFNTDEKQHIPFPTLRSEENSLDQFVSWCDQAFPLLGTEDVCSSDFSNMNLLENI